MCDWIFYWVSLLKFWLLTILCNQERQSKNCSGSSQESPAPKRFWVTKYYTKANFCATLIVNLAFWICLNFCISRSDPSAVCCAWKGCSSPRKIRRKCPILSWDKWFATPCRNQIFFKGTGHSESLAFLFLHYFLRLYVLTFWLNICKIQVRAAKDLARKEKSRRRWNLFKCNLEFFTL